MNEIINKLLFNKIKMFQMIAENLGINHVSKNKVQHKFIQ